MRQDGKDIEPDAKLIGQPERTEAEQVSLFGDHHANPQRHADADDKGCEEHVGIAPERDTRNESRYRRKRIPRDPRHCSKQPTDGPAVEGHTDSDQKGHAANDQGVGR